MTHVEAFCACVQVFQFAGNGLRVIFERRTIARPVNAMPPSKIPEAIKSPTNASCDDNSTAIEPECARRRDEQVRPRRNPLDSLYPNLLAGYPAQSLRRVRAASAFLRNNLPTRPVGQNVIVLSGCRNRHRLDAPGSARPTISVGVRRYLHDRRARGSRQSA